MIRISCLCCSRLIHRVPYKAYQVDIFSPFIQGEADQAYQPVTLKVNILVCHTLPLSPDRVLIRDSVQSLTPWGIRAKTYLGHRGLGSSFYLTPPQYFGVVAFKRLFRWLSPLLSMANVPVQGIVKHDAVIICFYIVSDVEIVQSGFAAYLDQNTSWTFWVRAFTSRCRLLAWKLAEGTLDV